MKMLRLPIVINKSNGQINSYFKQDQLPKSVRDAIKSQPNTLKKFLVEFRGVE